MLPCVRDPRAITPALFLMLLLLGPQARGEPSGGGGFLREHIYDTAPRGDEGIAGLRIASSRWPDATTLESAAADIFRLEGVVEGSDQDRALALWKWFRILVSATGGHYAYEGPRGAERLCTDPHRIFAVYGHHQCDGLSWAMVALWRAAGYMALDECTYGHTTAALRYRDADGEMRYHSFDPQHRHYWWDPRTARVGTRSLPVMRGMVYRHLTAPREIHGLHTSLRIGERVERRWTNEGRVVPSGPDKLAAWRQSYYAWSPGKQSGIYAAAGEEIQTLDVDTSPATYARSLHRGSKSTAASAAAEGKAILHPERAGEKAVFIWRLPPPYVVAAARCEAALAKESAGDLCRLSLSRDGETWETFHETRDAGREEIAVDIGSEAWRESRPNVFTAYEFFIRAELEASGGARGERIGAADGARGVRIEALRITAHRMLNQRTLPHLRPGENVIRVSAEALDPDLALELEIGWSIRGQDRSVTRAIRSFPYAFRIDVPQVEEPVHDNYDQRWNDGPLRMSHVRMRLLEREKAPQEEPSLPGDEVRGAFSAASPHPADMTHRVETERSERDARETSGLFPQADAAQEDGAALDELIARYRRAEREEKWIRMEELGAWPAAVDFILEELPRADIDMTLFICKSLARIGDPKAIPPLLAKWKRAPGGAPGTRYIPDALAAIGDRSVVPELIAPLERCRFDFRLHIARALGILGGDDAALALENLAANDPFPAVREEARRALEAMRAER